MWITLAISLSLVSVDALVGDQAQSAHEHCRKTLMSLQRFTTTPWLNVGRFEELYKRANAPGLSDFERQTRIYQMMTHLALENPEHEAWSRWFEYQFGGAWSSFINLSDNPKRLFEFFRMFKRYHEYGRRTFERERTAHPNAFSIFNATPRTWADWWQYFQYLDVMYDRPSNGSSSTLADNSFEIAFDSNLVINNQTQQTRVPELMEGLRRAGLAEGQFKSIVLPEVIAEVGEKIARQWETLNRPEMNGFRTVDLDSYLPLVEIFSKQRLEYENSKRYTHFKAVVQGVSADDRILAQVALRGVRLFFTQDGRMFDALIRGQHPNLFVRENPEIYRLNGRDYRQADVRVTYKNKEFTFTVVDLNEGSARKIQNGGAK